MFGCIEMISFDLLAELNRAGAGNSMHDLE